MTKPRTTNGVKSKHKSDTNIIAASPPDPLDPHHRRMLEQESAISQEILEARGYKTATVKAELGRHGFGTRQQKVPCLFIPIYGVSSRTQIA